jgi:hypothetical protein
MMMMAACWQCGTIFLFFFEWFKLGSVALHEKSNKKGAALHEKGAGQVVFLKGRACPKKTGFKSKSISRRVARAKKKRI